MAKRFALTRLPCDAAPPDDPIRDMVEIRSCLCGYALGTSLPPPGGGA
ncbi:hypothetical protein J2Y48_000321 [Mycoplana sp. BE70]|nr:hypothetical protein [Mycoplana sp. BE70]